MEFLDNYERAHKSLTFIAVRVYNIEGTVLSTAVHYAKFVPQIGKSTLVIFTPPGGLWLVNSPQSSWITGPLLLKVLEVARKRIRIYKEDSIILLKENHERHCTLDSILCARENVFTLVTFPPPPLINNSHWM